MYELQTRISFPYKIIEKNSALPLDLQHIKTHLKLDCIEDVEEYLMLLIDSASEALQFHTPFTPLITKFETLRDNWTPIELLKKPFQTLESFEYLKDGSFISVDSSIYEIKLKDEFAQVILKEDQSYPDDKDNVAESIKLVFTAGFGNTSADIKSDIRLAMLRYMAYMYANPGDCTGNCKCDIISKIFDSITHYSLS